MELHICIVIGAEIHCIWINAGLISIGQKKQVLYTYKTQIRLKTFEICQIDVK